MASRALDTVKLAAIRAAAIPLTAAEIRHLFNGLILTPLRAEMVTPLRVISEIQHRSARRRHHQGRARRSHYRRRLIAELGP